MDHFCGDVNYKDGVKNVEYEFDHSNSYIHIKFQSFLTGSKIEKSWGIGSIKLYYLSCNPLCADCQGKIPKYKNIFF